MSRIAFVVPPLKGHINPTLAIAEQLEQRGHQVAWVAHPIIAKSILPNSASLFELDDNSLIELFSAIEGKNQQVRGIESHKFLYESFNFPLAKLCLNEVESALKHFQPDAVICDQQMIAGAIACRRNHFPMITSATSSASILQSWPAVDLWLEQQFYQCQHEADIFPIVRRPDFSNTDVLVYSSPELIGDKTCYPANYHYLGPSIPQQAVQTTEDNFPWHLLDKQRKKILVSIGTVNAQRGQRFFNAISDALIDTDYQLIIVAPSEFAIKSADHWIVLPQVPQVELLKHIDLVICHAGQNTVSETLHHALPLLVAPIRDDQPIIAEQVVASGCGIQLRFNRCTAIQIREAVEKLLSDNTYRTAAAMIQKSFNQLGGAEQAATIIEERIQQVANNKKINNAQQSVTAIKPPQPEENYAFC